MAETSGWYDPAVYPELRSAAPWVMEDMIETQVMLPQALSESLAGSAPRLVEMLHAAADAGEPIVVSAVGTSGHSARAVALILNGAMGESAVAAGPAEARESADEALAPRRRGGWDESPGTNYGSPLLAVRVAPALASQQHRGGRSKSRASARPSGAP